MGIREKINQNPKQTTAITAAIVVVALAFILWQACSGGPGSGGVITTKAFYTTDDGKTFFVDSSSNIPPYQKDGKTAFRAQVCGGLRSGGRACREENACRQLNFRRKSRLSRFCSQAISSCWKSRCPSGQGTTPRFSRSSTVPFSSPFPWPRCAASP